MAQSSAAIAERYPRRLAAILCADTVGYTRLMSADESGTHTAYKACLDEVVEPFVATHGGRVVKTTGDGFVAVFDSVTDSLECAHAIQAALARRNSANDSVSRIDMRMGINLGDIIVEKNDVYGNGVNVAARLQALAEPGAVCVAGSVRDEAQGKLLIQFKRIGRRRLRNLSDPVEVYAFRPELSRDVSPADSEPDRQPSWRGWGRAIGLAAAATLVAAAVLLAWPGTLRFAGLAGSDPFEPALILPSKPSIAVLAFENQSRNPDDEYFADGIAEDIITDLSQQSALFVIARDSSFHYKSTRTPLKQIGAELGVRYLLQGSVRHDGGRIRVNVNLMDATSGANVWAERYDREADDLFRIQAEISQRTVAALTSTLLVEPVPGGPGTTSFSAHDLYLNGVSHLRRTTPQGTAQAVTLLKAALAIDSSYSQAHAALAAAYLQAYELLWHNHLGLGSQFTAKAMAIAEVKQAMANPSGLAYRIRAEINYSEGRYNQSTDDLAEALTRDPNDAAAFALLGKIYIRTGRPGDATMPLRVAMRLDPNQPVYEAVSGIAELALGRYSEAARLLEREFQRNPMDHSHLAYLAAAYGHLDRQERARAVVKVMNALRAKDNLAPYTLFDASKSTYYDDDCDLFRFREGLRLADVAAGQDPEPEILGKGCVAAPPP